MAEETDNVDQPTKPTSAQPLDYAGSSSRPRRPFSWLRVLGMLLLILLGTALLIFGICTIALMHS